jgi:hypothetical protein
MFSSAELVFSSVELKFNTVEHNFLRGLQTFIQ